MDLAPLAPASRARGRGTHRGFEFDAYRAGTYCDYFLWMLQHCTIASIATLCATLDTSCFSARKYTDAIPQNLIDLEKGPLREFSVLFIFFTCRYQHKLFDLRQTADEVLAALDAAWERVKPYASNYFH